MFCVHGCNMYSSCHVIDNHHSFSLKNNFSLFSKRHVSFRFPFVFSKIDILIRTVQCTAVPLPCTYPQLTFPSHLYLSQHGPNYLPASTLLSISLLEPNKQKTEEDRQYTYHSVYARVWECQIFFFLFQSLKRQQSEMVFQLNPTRLKEERKDPQFCSWWTIVN